MLLMALIWKISVNAIFFFLQESKCPHTKVEPFYINKIIGGVRESGWGKVLKVMFVIKFSNKLQTEITMF